MNTVCDYLSERQIDLKRISSKENKDYKHLDDNADAGVVRKNFADCIYPADEFGRDMAVYEDKFRYRIWCRVRNWDIAEEIFHDVVADMMKLHTKDKIASKDDLYRLMNHVARCKCINYLKKKSTHFEELTDSAEMDYFPLPSTYAPEEDIMRVVLYEHIALLKDTEQKVVRGKINEVPLEVIADELGRLQHAIECIYSRAVKKLKKMIRSKSRKNSRI